MRNSLTRERPGRTTRLPAAGDRPPRSREGLLLVLLVAVGAVVRVLPVRSIWLDEAISIHNANLSLHDMMLNLQYGDRHPPLHYIVLWATVKVLGDGELAVRLPSIIAGTLVIPALYLLGRELYDRRTGLVAAAFGTVSPLDRKSVV